MNKLMCSVYAAPNLEGLYVYIPKSEKLSSLPQALQQQLGQARWVIDILITEDKTLTRVTGAKVLEEISAKGFYLQMPPADKENLLAEHLRQLASDSPKS